MLNAFAGLPRFRESGSSRQIDLTIRNPSKCQYESERLVSAARFEPADDATDLLPFCDVVLVAGNCHSERGLLPKSDIKYACATGSSRIVFQLTNAAPASICCSTTVWSHSFPVS
jgi:hypothetical protein